MEFLKAVFLAVLIYTIAPLVVRFVEMNYLTNSVHKMQTAEGDASDSGMNR